MDGGCGEETSDHAIYMRKNISQWNVLFSETQLTLTYGNYRWEEAVSALD